MSSRPPIQEAALQQLSPAKRALLERRLARQAPRPSALGPIPRSDLRPAPLSFEQQRLWLLDQLTPGVAAYNVPRVLRLRGPLDVHALRLALDALLERHEPLRTRFELVDGNAVQVVSPNRGALLEVVDLTEMPRGDREREALRLAVETTARPFDLAGELLLRTQLVRLDPTDHLLALVSHHIVSDEGSRAILFDDLATLYASFRDGHPSPLAPPSLRYSDYAAWQRAEGAPSADGLAWWRQRLSGAPPALELPADLPRPPVQTHAGARYSSRFEPDFASELRMLAQRQRSTPFMVMLTAFAVLANRLSGEDDLVIGAPVSGRNRPELERVIGCFGNTVALRLDASGDPAFAELLGRTRSTAIDAFGHQDVPFERVVRELQPERDLSRSPVFQLMFNYFDGRAGDSSAVLAGVDVEQVEIDPGVSKFDLALVVAEGHDGLIVEWEYSTDLFERGTIERLHRRFERILRAAVERPVTPISELPLLDAREEHELLEAGRGPRLAFPADACVHELIAATAAERPDAIAVECGDHSLTYGELERRANGLAHRLIAHGAGGGTLVGVCVERCVELPVALLAVLKTGAAYIPLDPSYPKERLRLMLEDAGAPLVLASASLAGELPSTGATLAILEDELKRAGHAAEGPPVTGVEPSDLAYVIYTSGSTGRPKGVMIEH
ncbi:MAG TPA: condensation domain-containing protein, partial [Thermoleophilaceae bacterium]|nr:condensation domain-containing protein [Thermoleophilaceae bacterium]